MTTTEAAKELGISDAQIRRLIYAKQLPAQKVGNYNIINKSDLASLKDRPKRGRPKKIKE